MVAPTTGPFTSTVITKKVPQGVQWTYDAGYKARTWYRQRKPYNLPLVLTLDNRQTVKEWYGNPPNYRPYTNAPGYDTAERTVAYNKAYGKFVERVNEQSMWAVNLLEMKKSAIMIERRATQLLAFSRSLASGRFVKAAKILGLAAAPRGVSKKKSFANNWLEYHFGWEPLVKDIGAALHTLTDPFGHKTVKASGHSDKTYTLTGGGVVPYDNTWRKDFRISTSVRLQARVSVVNPNAFLLSQLGFVNPLSTAWELVPFSFVLDWFGNVGQVLASMTDFVGVQLDDPFQSTLQVGDEHEVWVYGQIGNPPSKWGTTLVDVSYQSVFVRRELGIGTPSLRFKWPERVSSTRGATAIALLLQFLKR